jgi:hypothetical protein
MTKITLNIPGYSQPIIITNENKKSTESESLVIVFGIIIYTLIAFGCNALKDVIIQERMKPYIDKLGEILKERYQEYINAYNYLKKRGIAENFKKSKKDIEGLEVFPIIKEEDFIKGAVVEVMKYIKDKKKTNKDELEFLNSYLHFYIPGTDSDYIYGMLLHLETISSKDFKNTSFMEYTDDTFTTLYIVSKLIIPENILNELRNLK